jgi:hypothetical protein
MAATVVRSLLTRRWSLIIQHASLPTTLEENLIEEHPLYIITQIRANGLPNYEG